MTMKNTSENVENGSLPVWAKEKLDKIMTGEAVVVGEDWLNLVEGSDIMNNIVTIPNPNRLGAKDLYIAGLPSNTQIIKAFRFTMGLEG